MIYHPHLHCLIPGLGITPDGDVLLSRKKYLIPVKALSAIFRGRFLELARKAVPEEDFSIGGDVKKWVVFSKPVETKNVQRVLHYLGRYLHRMAISNSAILKVESGKVTFRYKKYTDKHGKSQWGIMPLEAMEFLRRFLRRGGRAIERDGKGSILWVYGFWSEKTFGSSSKKFNADGIFNTKGSIDDSKKRRNKRPCSLPKM